MAEGNPNAPERKPLVTSHTPQEGAKEEKKAAPPPLKVTAPPPAKKKRSKIVSCLLWLFVLILILIGLAGGAYYAYTQGYLSQRQIMKWMGQEPAEISIVNIDDKVFDARISWVDQEENETLSDSLRVQSFEMSHFSGLESDYYDLEVTMPETGEKTVCRLAMDRGDVYQLVIVPKGISITKEGYESKDGDDMVIPTSSLCISQ